MSKKSFLGQSYGGLKKSAKICWRYPSLNSCHGHKLGRNVKISVTIGKPTTRRLFWAVKMSKKSIAGPSYGGLKKVVAKSYTKWGLPSLNGRHGHKLWRNQKISMPISKTIAWRLFWAVKFFKKVFPSLSYGRSKLGDKSWYFCHVLRPLCHFFWLSLFSLPLCIFFGNFLSNPPQKIRPEGTPALKGLALLRNAVAPSGLRPFGTDFLGGGYNWEKNITKVDSPTYKKVP